MDRTARETAVDWFAAEMKEKLAQPRNVAKGGWRGDLYHVLMRRLREEVEELDLELMNPQSSHRSVIDEAVDVANFAMMIAEKACLESRPALLHDVLGITPEHARKMAEEHGGIPSRDSIVRKLIALDEEIDRAPNLGAESDIRDKILDAVHELARMKL